VTFPVDMLNESDKIGSGMIDNFCTNIVQNTKDGERVTMSAP
jgi:hypothetical protein